MTTAPAVSTTASPLTPSGGVAAVEVRQLEVVYGRAIRAVQGISLHAEPRKVTALLGPNGAGKTTVLRGITGFFRAENAHVTNGTVLFEGVDVTAWNPGRLARRGVVLVPERDKIFVHLSVSENLAVSARRIPPRQRRDAVERELDRFPPLRRLSKRQAGYLSGGERQMLALARGLLLSPRVLLVDELSLGLAPVVVADLVATLAAVAETGPAVLLVEQNAATAFALATHVYILENGKIVAEGASEELARHQDVREFYLGEGQAAAYAAVKQYRRKRRWW